MKNWKRTGRRFAALALLLAVLTGCAVQTGSAAQAGEPAAQSFSVHYMFRGLYLKSQTVAEGQRPEKLDFSQDGLVFRGWLDAAGNEVEPSEIPVTGETVYNAGAYPDLGRHVPWLFPDAAGLLHPDEPLTADALRASIEALATPEAEQYLPELPEGEAAVTGAEFLALMQELFSPEAAALGCGDLEPEAALTRSRAAEALAELLGRDCVRVTLRREAGRPLDVTPERPDYTTLLEASVSHVPDADGVPWQEAGIPLLREPGFFLMEGRLVYITDKGKLLAGGSPEGSTLEFDAEGFYTSGSAELDEYVTEILQSLAEEQPDAEREELLRAAYKYARDSFTYLRKAYYAFGAAGWEVDAALEMLDTEMGNCYNYAAVFWALARGLGYEARAYSGTIGADPHGWVEIAFDGVDYVFDPELEMADLRQGYDNDRYMLSPQAALQYGGYYRMRG